MEAILWVGAFLPLLGAGALTFWVARLLLSGLLHPSARPARAVEAFFPVRGRWLQYLLATVMMAVFVPLFFLCVCVVLYLDLTLLIMGMGGGRWAGPP